MVEHNTVVIAEDASDDASWRTWSDREFWLVLWLVESTADAICLIPSDADRKLRRKAERLIAQIHAHQDLRDLRRVTDGGIGADAGLILSRERVATRLDALHARGHWVRFRPSAEISAIELSLAPAAR